MAPNLDASEGSLIQAHATIPTLENHRCASNTRDSMWGTREGRTLGRNTSSLVQPCLFRRILLQSQLIKRGAFPGDTIPPSQPLSCSVMVGSPNGAGAQISRAVPFPNSVRAAL